MTCRGKDIIALLSGDFRPEMIEALRRIKKAGFKTGCITNNVPANMSGSNEGRALYAREIMEMFDHRDRVRRRSASANPIRASMR